MPPPAFRSASTYGKYCGRWSRRWGMPSRGGVSRCTSGCPAKPSRPRCAATTSRRSWARYSVMPHQFAESRIDVTLEGPGGEVPGDVFRVRVRDDGAGIDRAEKARICERFYTSDKCVSGSGLGLGLAVAKSLATRMGAVLGVESAVGQWTEFTGDGSRSVHPSVSGTGWRFRSACRAAGRGGRAARGAEAAARHPAGRG